MKTNRMLLKPTVAFTVIVLLTAALFTGCDNGLFGPSMPRELIGTWSWTGAASYVEEFTFTSSEISYYGYSQAYPGEFDASWSRDLEEVYVEDEILRTDNDMYLAYHIVGDILYLYKTNPGSDYPDLPSAWWTTMADYILDQD
ncbi:MAG: hypothetical protein JW760_06185 [Spirochaetales bacterium]|nr:hypothetical protein [Spirochaetales bacterium]